MESNNINWLNKNAKIIQLLAESLSGKKHLLLDELSYLKCGILL